MDKVNQKAMLTAVLGGFLGFVISPTLEINMVILILSGAFITLLVMNWVSALNTIPIINPFKGVKRFVCDYKVQTIFYGWALATIATVLTYRFAGFIGHHKWGVIIQVFIFYSLLYMYFYQLGQKFKHDGAHQLSKEERKLMGKEKHPLTDSFTYLKVGMTEFFISIYRWIWDILFLNEKNIILKTHGNPPKEESTTSGT